MKVNNFETAQGHWILAKMGKRVLRPGGKELTTKLINSLDITSKDNLVEFAPGLGYTAKLALAKRPNSYVGIDADEDVINYLRKKLGTEKVQFKLATAAQSGLTQGSKDIIIGEAMLTMHADHRKAEIIHESHRLLKKGGIYAIHELGLKDVNQDLKDTIQRDLAQTIKVNARPLTEQEWKTLLMEAGFAIKTVYTNEMHLLENKRIIDDEGWWRALKITFNILINPAARKRIQHMRNVFNQYDEHLNSIAIIAEKI